MKNFISFIEPKDIFNYVGNIWRSDIFKQSHNNPTGYIHQIVDQFSKVPRVFFEMHIESMEMVHFSSWFHAIQHRHHYTNDVLHDLYYHHELYHLITMTYRKDFTFESWQAKMKDNEFWASLESEVLIYFYMPELRQISFKEEIWADKFLNNAKYNALYGAYFDGKNEASEVARLDIAWYRNDCELNPITLLDKQISDYTISSREWAQIWNENKGWVEVESHMTNYLKEVKKNPVKAINMHIAWLNHLQSLDEDNIAFGNEARLYTAVHRRLFQSAYTPLN